MESEGVAVPRTRIWAIVIGVILGLVGAVWLLQGIGVVKGSFMTGQPIWAIIGLVAAARTAGLPSKRFRRRVVTGTQATNKGTTA